MPKNFYTLLILPKKDSSAKKISLSSTLVKGVSIFVMGLLLFVMYFSYDYIHIRREQAELKRLKQQTAEQRKQIDGLVAKVDQFSMKMDELRQFDKKIRIMAKLVTGRDKEQLLGIGGPVSEENRLRSKMAADDKTMIAGINSHVDRLMDDAVSREQSFTALLTYLQEKKSLLAATPSSWPVLGWVTSEFGRRISPFGSGTEFHKGIDIATRIGRPVQAPADGIVAEVAYQHDLGQMVQIDHGHGVSTLYGHLSKAAVRSGMTIRKGDRIGYVGNTGSTTGSHLHYTVMLNGVPVNPRKYIN
ncbi:MAG: peptidoglycan DD-metalloendopeptidase family protein [Deltaproteobacteria bacterium]|nr:peptidoglycan DD-metalloendopeptidase family protein [Deltaproteobacteria bacterium]